MVAAETNSPPSSLQNVLGRAEEDLLHAEFPGIVGGIFNPVRDAMLSPALGVAADVLPAVSGHIPFADDVAAVTLGAAFGVVKAFYGIIPHPPGVADEAIEIERDEALKAEKLAEEQLVAFDKQQQAVAVSKPNPIVAVRSLVVVKTKEIQSLLAAAWGFGVTTTLDVVAAPFTGKMSDWTDTLKTFIGYLLYTGMSAELLSAFMTPRVFDNLTIVANEQEKLDVVGSCGSRRERSSIGHYPIPVSEFKPLLRESARYFRYMAAAYGVSMIKASKDITEFHTNDVNLFGAIMKPFNDLQQFFRNSHEAARRRKIAQYVNVHEEDVIYMTPPGAKTTSVGYFVAVDHKCEAVVLAIRGTFSLSEIFTDGEAWGAQFCGGTAHKGISERASDLWVHPKTNDATELQKLVAATLLYLKATRNKLYKIVITGHSLGAGVAACLNLKIHYDSPPSQLIAGVDDVQVECFGVASPPVYIPGDSDPKRTRIEAAMDHCVCFIHEDDCVPFLSADAIRRLCVMLEKVDKHTKEMNFVEQRLVAGKVKEPDSAISEAVSNGSNDLPIIPEALRFAIPSKFVLWLRQDATDDKGRPAFNAMFCSPDEICKRSILLSKNMINHHMPPFYERAIYSVLENVIKSGEKEYMLAGGAGICLAPPRTPVKSTAMANDASPTSVAGLA